jgi:hypothetical protein
VCRPNGVLLVADLPSADPLRADLLRADPLPG